MSETLATELSKLRSYSILRSLKKDINAAYLSLQAATAEEQQAQAQFFVEAVETLAFAFNASLIDGECREFIKGYVDGECRALETRQDVIGDFWRKHRDSSADAFCEIKVVLAASKGGAV